jgi:CRISPR-associated protein Csd1
MPLARLHPAVKGVYGAQSSGASIVSFNLESFTSYGKSQGENAPVSEQAAFAYTTVLNHLLRRSEHNRQRIQIGDASVVFWAEADDAEQAQEAEFTFESLLEDPPDDSQEAARVREVLDQVAKGRPLSELNPKLQDGTRMYVLGLAPTASRISIRFWEAGTLGTFAQRLAQHERDMRIEPVPWKTAPAARRVVLATVPNREGAMPKMDDAFNNLVGEFMRAVLSGGLYPRSLLANTLMRIRTDGNLSGLRAAICKGILAREQRLGINTQNEEVPVSLDKESTSPGYRLGRLFAVLEAVQRAALGGQVNATIRDRYYGAASATPASVFPVLLRNAQNHLGKLRREKPGLAVNMEKDIGEIVDGLPEHFPRSLRMEAQGQFAIGYYHQSQSRFRKAADDTTDTPEGDTE